MTAKRPNFFIVGAPKCGTTAWVRYLEDHPDIHFSPTKEPHYFCTDFPRYRWADSEESYLANFADAGNEKIVAEASVRYLYSKEASRRIHAFNRDARILILLRRQSRFLPSYHNQVLNNGDESERDFARVWRISRDGLTRRVPSRCREPSFLDYRAVGDFETQVARYLEVFEPHQVRVAWMEDWREDPASLYLWLMDFLGTTPQPRASFPRVNAAYHHRLRLLAYFTSNPPPWVLRLSAGVKRLLGVERLNIAPRLRALNRAQGYHTAEPSPELQAEIDDHYRASNARLRARLAELGIEFAPDPAGRPMTHAGASRRGPGPPHQGPNAVVPQPLDPK